jgi:hypothetical protein
LWGKGLDGDKGERAHGAAAIEQSEGLVCGWAVPVGSRGMGTTLLFDAMGERVIGKSGIVVCR